MESKWKWFLKRVVPKIALVIMIVSFILMVIFGIHIIVDVAAKLSFWMWLLDVIAAAWFGVNVLWNLLIWLLLRKLNKE